VPKTQNEKCSSKFQENFIDFYKKNRYNIYKEGGKIMKYCLSGRQPLSVLKKCDEVKMQYVDKDRILDYIETLSDKMITLDIPAELKAEDLNWTLFKMYSEKVNFALCLHDLSLVNSCKEYKIKFYWAYPITSFFELRGIINLEPCYLFLGAPLCFDLPKIKALTNIPIRLCPNLAYDAYIPRENGIYGSWVRPEDIGVYEKFVDMFEFETDELKREQVLLHIYKDNGNWPGNLNLLFTNFNVNIDNCALPEEVGEVRTSCGQRCMSNGTCTFCLTSVKFADIIRKKHYEGLTSQS
jgi:hypothetical protein